MPAVTISPTGSISSHTLSAQSIHPPPTDPQEPSSQALITALSTTPHTFLQPTASLHSAALSFAKGYLDPLAAGISELQQQRLKDERKKRKRGREGYEEEGLLQLKRVHVEGFGVDQVWEQARRVVEAARREVERVLPELVLEERGAGEGLNGAKVVRFDEDGFEEGSEFEEEEGSEDDIEGELEDEEDGMSEIEEDEAFDEDADLDVDEDADGFDDEMDGLADDYDEDEDIGLDEDDEGAAGEQATGSSTYVSDRFGLNDGFFSIDDFNKQSEFLEQQDVRGDNDGAASDEEDIDWNADVAAIAKPTKLGEDGEEEDDDDDEEDGPTFGNMDLNAPLGASDDEMDDESIAQDDMDGGMGNANEIFYGDFFAPPAKKAGKNKKKRGRPNPHNFPAKEDTNGAPAADDDDMERTMAAVHRDLFEDEASADENDNDLSDLDPADPKSRRSTHERRQAKLAEEIRRLEAANVAKREWTLSGEARAVDRPLNSLLEEDLEFERAGKPVPVITAEVSEDIEDMIKRRILAQEFDEVLRRRPDDLITGPQARRGRFELDDTKATKGLAEEYEEEHLRKTDPNYVDVKDEKLKKQHKEIEGLWRDVSAKLDALSNWHYKPKPATPNIEVRVDAPTISLEDARPTAGADVAASMLAPQEIYRPGETKGKAEIVTKGGMPVARDEMTREQKLRRRRREKERIRKAGDGGSEKPKSKKAEEKSNIIGQLKKGGVRVIGKRGEVTDVQGQAIKQGGERGGAGNLKL